MQICAALFKCICFYTSRCGQSVGPVWEGFLSGDITLRCKAPSLFGRVVLLRHLHLCLIFVQYLSIWTISYYKEKPWTMAKAYNGFVCLFLCVAAVFCTTSLQISQTLDIVKCTGFYCFAGFCFHSFIKVIFHCAVLPPVVRAWLCTHSGQHYGFCLRWDVMNIYWF